MSEYDFLTLIVASISLVLAVGSAYLAWENRKRDIPFDVVSKDYERYYEIDRIELEYPHLTHMFVTDDKYEQIKALVRKAAADLNEAKASAYVLQERAVADFILSYYEQNLVLWDNTGDKEYQFIKDIIEYFEGRLLRNPRLVWWWQKDHGGLETSYDPDTRSRWLEHVFKKLDRSKPEWCDSDGPFAPLGRL
jgi:hypothetical protein